MDKGKIKEYNQEYYKKNKERIKEQVRRYAENNKEERKEMGKEWRRKNHTALTKIRKRYYMKNKEEIFERNRLWKKNNKEKVNARNMAERLVKLKSACEICSSKERLQRHHWNYKKPLMVNTLCSDCHTIQHIKNFGGGQHRFG